MGHFSPIGKSIDDVKTTLDHLEDTLSGDWHSKARRLQERRWQHIREQEKIV